MMISLSQHYPLKFEVNKNIKHAFVIEHEVLLLKKTHFAKWKTRRELTLNVPAGFDIFIVWKQENLSK